MLRRTAELAGSLRCIGCGRRGGMLCRSCATKLPLCDPPVLPGVDRSLTCWSYEGTARALVLALKLRGLRDAAAPLGEGMARAVSAAGLRAGVVTWVPGRRKDIAARGFDHAAVLAHELADRTGLRLRPLLFRARPSADQASLSASERMSNLEGVFGAVTTGERVAVVDDVVTTGATARACARALRAVGASSVELVAACRTARE